MIKIAVCDNEPVMCETLKEMVSSKLGQWGEAFRITSYIHGASLLVSPLDFDLIFLDIQMPGLDGMELARRLREKEFGGILIFVTVLKECMEDAFEVEAMDYLCKPVDKDRLERALKRSLKRLGDRQQRYLVVKTMSWCRKVNLRDIYYCEVMNRKIFLHTRSGILEYYGKMKDLERQTEPFFIRCHRSFLVNPDYVWEYGEGQVILKNEERVPVSKHYHQALIERMMHYMDEEG
ncbi:MAG: response regulator transcription factor [Hungatella sp.]|nr:response regulator transcription factor [Hungatella sp.]